jgi:regulator of replication initiation timing
VGLLERLGEFGASLITINQQVGDLRETLRDLRGDVKGLQAEMQGVRERLAKVETFQQAARAELAADLSRFKAEVERAEIQLSRSLPAPKGKKST